MIARFLSLALAGVLWAGLACAQIDINTASSQQLDSLKGIGPAKARAIVDYRRQHGPFRSVDELQQVPGIGAATLAALRAGVTVGDSPAPAPLAAKERPAAAVGQRSGVPAPARPAVFSPTPSPSSPPLTRPAVPAQPARPSIEHRPASPSVQPRPATPVIQARPVAPARPAVPAHPAVKPAATHPATPAMPARPAQPAGLR